MYAPVRNDIYYFPLFHKFIDGLTQIIDGLRISRRHCVHHAVPHVVFQNHLAGVIQGGADSGKLNQHLGAVVALLHHSLHLFQMPDGPGQAVDDSLLVLMDMAVGVGNAVGVEVGVIMFVVMLMDMIVFVVVVMIVMFRHTLSPLYHSKVYYTTAVKTVQPPEGDILTKINVLTPGGFGTII